MREKSNLRSAGPESRTGWKRGTDSEDEWALEGEPNGRKSK